MTEAEAKRPTNWREREAGGSFAGWIAPSGSEVRMAWVAAVVIAAPSVIYRLAFAEQFARGGSNLIVPAAWALISVPFWCRAVFLLILPTRFRVENGRLLLRKFEIGMAGLGTANLALSDVRAVRADSRLIVGKRSSYKVWDVVVDTQDGASHRVRLAYVVAAEATWIARRVASAAGVTTPVFP